MPSTWIFGAIINIAGSIAINLGTNVMKLGHNKRAMLDMPEEEKPSIAKSRHWRVGIVVFIIGNIANFVSFAFAAQSLLAALGSVQFVSNVLFASFVLKEKITALILIATGCIIGGCIVLVVFGNHTSAEYTVEDLLSLYRKPVYIVYLVMMFVFVFGSYIVYLHGKKVLSAKGKENSTWVQILPVSYSIFSALLGTQSVLFSKSLSVLLKSTFDDENQLGNWYTWITLMCFVVSAGFWVTRLNKGLRMFPAMIIVPLMQICWTLFSIISGMLYFEEYTSFTTLKAVMFVLGVLTVFVGVYLLTKSGRGQQQSSGYEKMEEGQKVEMVDNPAFDAASPEEADIPKKHGGLDTLRFTSLASTTTNITKSPKKNLNGTARSPDGAFAANSTYGSNSILNSTAGAHKSPHKHDDEEEEDEEEGDDHHNQSMMSTVKRRMQGISKRVKSDFGVLDIEAVKNTFGLGDTVTGAGLYSIPVIDFNASSRQEAGEDGRSKYPPSHGSDMLSALPQSRFYAKEGPGSPSQTAEALSIDPGTTPHGRTSTNTASPVRAMAEMTTSGPAVRNIGDSSPNNINKKPELAASSSARRKDLDQAAPGPSPSTQGFYQQLLNNASAAPQQLDVSSFVNTAGAAMNAAYDPATARVQFGGASHASREFDAYEMYNPENPAWPVHYRGSMASPARPRHMHGSSSGAIDVPSRVGSVLVHPGQNHSQLSSVLHAAMGRQGSSPYAHHSRSGSAGSSLTGSGEYLLLRADMMSDALVSGAAVAAAAASVAARRGMYGSRPASANARLRSSSPAGFGAGPGLLSLAEPLTSARMPSVHLLPGAGLPTASSFGRPSSPLLLSPGSASQSYASLLHAPVDGYRTSSTASSTAAWPATSQTITAWPAPYEQQVVHQQRMQHAPPGAYQGSQPGFQSVGSVGYMSLGQHSPRALGASRSLQARLGSSGSSSPLRGPALSEARAFSSFRGRPGT